MEDKSAHNEIRDFYAHMALTYSATSQGTFVVIPEISHSDISYIIRRKRETLPSALLAFYF